jgi:hypothetical protein
MMNIEVYKLEIRASVTKMERDPNGYDRFSNEQLSVNQTVDLGSLDFLELCKVLGAVHDLGNQIKEAHEMAA